MFHNVLCAPVSSYVHIHGTCTIYIYIHLQGPGGKSELHLPIFCRSATHQQKFHSGFDQVKLNKIQIQNLKKKSKEIKHRLSTLSAHEPIL